MKYQAQKIRGQLWVHVNGKTIAVAEKKKSFVGAKSSAGQTGDLLSPMPGKITKILKNANDSVMAGDAVLVMEAMKMEYTLKSEKDGVLESLTCKVGDQVPLGKILAKIK